MGENREGDGFCRGLGYGGGGGDAKRNTGVEEWEEEEASPAPAEGGKSSYPSYNAWGE